MAWVGSILVAAFVLIGIELSRGCPPGGPLAFGDCERVRPFGIGTVIVAAVLYAVGLSAVRWWTAGLERRGLADRRACRDWYLLAAGAGLLAAPLLGFTLVSALR